MKKLFLLILIIFSTDWRVSAEVLTEDQRAIVDQYSKSIRSKRHEAIDEAWKALNQEKEILEYLKTSRPRLYFSYKAWEVARQVDAIKTKIALRSIITDEEPAHLSIERRNSYTNADVVADFPNSERPNNREDIERRR